MATLGPSRRPQGLTAALWLALGWLSLGLGILGLLLPLLPTTPFVLLAAWCFAKGSPRWHSWLLASPYLGPQLRLWQEHRGIAPRVKNRAILIFVLGFGASLLLMPVEWPARLALLALGLALLVFLLRLPEVRVQDA
jgi:uncharacterized membrane protein YbaN (DUF454 family)